MAKDKDDLIVEKDYQYNTERMYIRAFMTVAVLFLLCTTAYCSLVPESQSSIDANRVESQKALAETTGEIQAKIECIKSSKLWVVKSGYNSPVYVCVTEQVAAKMLEEE